MFWKWLAEQIETEVKPCPFCGWDLEVSHLTGKHQGRILIVGAGNCCFCHMRWVISPFEFINGKINRGLKIDTSSGNNTAAFEDWQLRYGEEEFGSQIYRLNAVIAMQEEFITAMGTKMKRRQYLDRSIVGSMTITTKYFYKSPSRSGIKPEWYALR